MAITFSCAACGRSLQAPLGSEGKKARCPECQAVSQIPHPAAEQPGTIDATYSGDSPRAPSHDLAGMGPAPGQTENAEPLFGSFGSATSDPSDTRLNPYTSPGVVDPPVKTYGELKHHVLELNEFMSTTWRIFTVNFAPIALLGLVMVPIQFGVYMFNQTLSTIANATGEEVIAAGVGLFTFVLGFVVQTWVQLGGINCMIHLVRTGKVEIGKFFDTLSGLRPALIVAALITLISMAAFLVAALPTVAAVLAVGINRVDDNVAVMVTTVIVGIVGFIAILTWVQLSLFLSVPLIADRGVSALEAMRMSSEFMRGNRIAALIALVVYGFCGLILSCGSCGLGFIWFAPVMVLLNAVAYFMITGQPLRLTAR